MTKRTVALFICIALVALLLVLSGTVFVVKDVTVTDYYGQDVEDKQDIIEYSKLIGNNVFTISEETAIKNIEGMMPEINVVQIVRAFPSGVEIVIHKRVPILAVEVEEDEYAILDRECMVIGLVDNLDEYEGITIVQGFSSVSAQPGKTMTASGSSVARLGQIVQTFEQIGEHGYRDRNFCLVTEAIRLSGEDVSIKMREGAELRFNASVDYFGKLHSLISFYDSHEDKRGSGVYTVGVRNESGEYQILESA